MFWLELVILLACIVVGARYGGIALGAVSFDQTGTTRIGKYLLNHSFMIPGLVTAASAVVLAMLIVSIVGL